MSVDHDRLIATAELQEIATAKSEKWWNRAPFLYTIMSGLLALTALGAVWTTSISIRLGKIEDLSVEYKNEHVVETMRNNKEYIGELRKENAIEVLHQVRRNEKQIRMLNTTMYGIPDPGEP